MKKLTKEINALIDRAKKTAKVRRAAYRDQYDLRREYAVTHEYRREIV